MSRQSCIRCYKVPIDILILQCDHSLCIKCATQICQLNTCCIKCPRCKYETYLDEQLINQIQQFCVQFQQQQTRGNSHHHKYRQERQTAQYVNGYNSNGLRQTINKNKNKPNKQRSSLDCMPNMNLNNQKVKKNKIVKQQIIQSYDYNEMEDNFDASKSIQKKNTKKLKNQKILTKQERINTQPEVFFCKDHRQYQLLYICLECDNIFICPECIIHGVHKNHQVQTIKKMITKIHSELSSKIYSLDCSIEGLIKASQDRKLRLKEKIDLISKLKQETIIRYKNIRDELARQQAEIIQNCHLLMQEFEKDFNQTQMWIKNDLITIEKEKDAINYILNPSNTSPQAITLKRMPKLEQRISQMKIVQEYFNHFKRNEKLTKKNYLWLNKKQNQMQFQGKSEENLQVLTDRIQKIKLNSTILNNKPEAINHFTNNMTTKHGSLAVSRSRQNHSSYDISSIKHNRSSSSKVPESPFNLLKVSNEKQNLIPEAQSILVNGSRNNQSRRIKKKTLKSEQQNNYLVF